MNRFAILFWGYCCFAPLVLLSQTTGAEGKLLRTELYRNYKASDSTAYQRVIYAYPTPTQRVETTSQFEMGAWLEQTRLNYTLDALGRTRETIFERYDPNAKLFLLQTRIQSFPRGNSLTQTDSVFTYNWSENQNKWELYISQFNRFNNQNQLIEAESSISFSGQNFRNRDLNFYNAQGQLVRIENYSLINGQLTPSGFVSQVYENGLIKSSTRYTFIPPADSIPQSRTFFNYTPNKLISSTESFTWDLVTMSWKKTFSSAFTYNAQQQIQSQTATVIINNVPQKSRIDIFYTQKGNIARELTFQGSDEPTEWAIDTKKFYFYNQISSLNDPALRTKPFKISPNPSADEVRLELPLGTYFQVFNAGGQLQTSGIMNGQKNMDIRTWPSGLYWVIGRKDAEILLGKIIKR